MRLSGVLDHVGKRLGKAVRKQKQRRYSHLFEISHFFKYGPYYMLGSASFPFKFSFYGSFFLNSLAKPLILSVLRKSFLFLTLSLSTDLRKKNPFLFPFHNMKG